MLTYDLNVIIDLVKYWKSTKKKTKIVIENAMYISICHFVCLARGDLI